MAERWKTEYHVCDADGDAFAWCDTRDEARKAAKASPAAFKIERVTYYYNDRETVWERDA